MSDFTVHIVEKATWEPIDLPAGVTFSPKNWDALAVGGPDLAEVEMTGPVERLADSLNWLGLGMWIIAPKSEYVWWGEIEAVRVSINGTVVGKTLEDVTNAVKVIYTVFDPGGGVSSGETGWAEDADSIALYGRRERRHAAENPMREAQAIALRDTLLGRVSKPALVIDSMGGGTETLVTLSCIGFWRRLSKVYYGNAEGLTEYTTGSLAHPLGLGFTSNLVAGVTGDGRYSLHDIDGKFKGFALPGLQFKISGMANGGNNKVYTVESGDAKEPKVLTANNIEFDPADDIQESPLAFQLVDFAAGDVILISGAYDGANNGSHLVKSPGSTHLEISPGWSNPIVAAGAGFNVTIKRGNGVKVEQSTANERVGASATVRAYGQGIAQRFQTGTAAAWAIDAVEIKVRRVGTPTDDIEIRLVTDSGGTFGTWVATAYIDDTDIPSDDGGTWLTAYFDNKISLAPGTWYWLGIQRVGAAHHENYYEVWLDEAAGYSGTLLLSDGTSYQTPAVAKSLCFRVLGAVDTADQVAAICTATNVFTAVTVLAPSGIKTNQWRDGTQIAAYEVGELLDTGNSANTRLIAQVGHQGNVTIRPVPAKNEAMHVWKGANGLCTVQGSQEIPGVIPVAHWCHVDNQLLLQGAMAEMSPVLIEYGRYEPERGWELRAAGQPDPWNVAEVRNG